MLSISNQPQYATHYTPSTPDCCDYDAHPPTTTRVPTWWCATPTTTQTSTRLRRDYLARSLLEVDEPNHFCTLLDKSLTLTSSNYSKGVRRSDSDVITITTPEEGIHPPVTVNCEIDHKNVRFLSDAATANDDSPESTPEYNQLHPKVDDDSVAIKNDDEPLEKYFAGGSRSEGSKTENIINDVRLSSLSDYEPDLKIEAFRESGGSGAIIKSVELDNIIDEGIDVTSCFYLTDNSNSESKDRGTSRAPKDGLRHGQNLKWLRQAAKETSRKQVETVINDEGRKNRNKRSAKKSRDKRRSERMEIIEMNTVHEQRFIKLHYELNTLRDTIAQLHSWLGSHSSLCQHIHPG